MSNANEAGRIREGDVFHFRYTDAKERFMPYHCFDGKLIAFKQSDGTMLLRDTYWLTQHNGFAERSDTRTFTEDEARKQGELSLVCNLNDVEIVREGETVYFDDADCFDLSYQSNCYPCFAIRKGAERSKEKMLRVVAQRVEKTERDIVSANWNLERLAEYAKKIEAGQFDEVYL